LHEKCARYGFIEARQTTEETEDGKFIRTVLSAGVLKDSLSQIGALASGGDILRNYRLGGPLHKLGHLREVVRRFWSRRRWLCGRNRLDIFVLLFGRKTSVLSHGQCITPSIRPGTACGACYDPSAQVCSLESRKRRSRVTAATSPYGAVFTVVHSEQMGAPELPVNEGCTVTLPKSGSVHSSVKARGGATGGMAFENGVETPPAV